MHKLFDSNKYTPTLEAEQLLISHLVPGVLAGISTLVREAKTGDASLKSNQYQHVFTNIRITKSTYDYNKVWNVHCDVSHILFYMNGMMHPGGALYRQSKNIWLASIPRLDDDGAITLDRYRYTFANRQRLIPNVPLCSVTKGPNKEVSVEIRSENFDTQESILVEIVRSNVGTKSLIVKPNIKGCKGYDIGAVLASCIVAPDRELNSIMWKRAVLEICDEYLHSSRGVLAKVRMCLDVAKEQPIEQYMFPSTLDENRAVSSIEVEDCQVNTGAILLCEAMVKLFRVELSEAVPDDIDDFSNKIVDTYAIPMAKLFRKLVMKEQVKLIDFVEARPRIYHQLVKAIRDNDWEVVKDRNSRLQISRLLELASSISIEESLHEVITLAGIHASANTEEGKFTLRYEHYSQRGYLCIVRCTDDAKGNAGLRNYLASDCRICLKRGMWDNEMDRLLEIAEKFMNMLERDRMSNSNISQHSQAQIYTETYTFNQTRIEGHTSDHNPKDSTGHTRNQEDSTGRVHDQEDYTRRVQSREDSTRYAHNREDITRPIQYQHDNAQHTQMSQDFAIRDKSHIVQGQHATQYANEYKLVTFTQDSQDQHDSHSNIVQHGNTSQQLQSQRTSKYNALEHRNTLQYTSSSDNTNTNMSQHYNTVHDETRQVRNDVEHAQHAQTSQYLQSHQHTSQYSRGNQHISQDSQSHQHISQYSQGHHGTQSDMSQDQQNAQYATTQLGNTAIHATSPHSHDSTTDQYRDMRIWMHNFKVVCIIDMSCASLMLNMLKTTNPNLSWSMRGSVIESRSHYGRFMYKCKVDNMTSMIDTREVDRVYDRITTRPSLFSILVNEIPYKQHCPVARLLLGAKQIQKCAYDVPNNDPLVEELVLIGPQRPMVTTSKWSGVCFGYNAVVLYDTISGYNVEDGVVVSKAAVERGAFATFKTRRIVWKKLDDTTVTNYNIFINLKQTVKYGTILAYVEYTDEYGSVSYAKIKHNRYYSCIVQDVRLYFNSPPVTQSQTSSYNSDKCDKRCLSEIHIYLVRFNMLNNGNKITTDKGQKAVVVQVATHDMPFIDDYRYPSQPDVIVNPLSIVARSTVASNIVSDMSMLLLDERGSFVISEDFGSSKIVTLVNDADGQPTYTSKTVDHVQCPRHTVVVNDGETGEHRGIKNVGMEYYLTLNHIADEKIRSKSGASRDCVTGLLSSSSYESSGRKNWQEDHSMQHHNALTLLNSMYNTYDNGVFPYCEQCNMKTDVNQSGRCIRCDTDVQQTIEMSRAFDTTAKLMSVIGVETIVRGNVQKQQE